MKELSSHIRSWPLQAQLEINGITCLFAHAQASPPGKRETDEFYLLGDEVSREHFIRYGIEGCVTFCGHIGTSNFRNCGGQYLDEEGSSIWRNETQNGLWLRLCQRAAGLPLHRNRGALVRLKER